MIALFIALSAVVVVFFCWPERQPDPHTLIARPARAPRRFTVADAAFLCVVATIIACGFMVWVCRT